MASLFHLPQDVWRENVLPLVSSLRGLVLLDSALNNKSCRAAFHNCVRGMKHEWMLESDKRALKWFQKRHILVHSIAFVMRERRPEPSWVGSFLSTMRRITGRDALHHSRIFQRTIKTHGNSLTFLYIEANDIRDVSGLRYATHLIDLRVHRCNHITSDSFVHGISGCTKLRICSIAYSNLLGEEAIAAVLFYCKELQELTVSEPANLDSVFAHITQPLHLRKFDWQHPFPIVTSQVLHTIANQMPLLEHLAWNMSTPGTFTGPDFHQVIINCVHMKELKISGPGFFTDQSLLHMGQSLTSLRYIDLTASAEVSDAGVVALAQGCRLLEYLNLSFLSTLTDVAIQAVGTHCQLLATLAVCYCTQLTDRAFRTLNVERLRYVNVSGTPLDGTFTKYLLRGASAVFYLGCESCPNLHINLLRMLPPFNRLSTLSLGHISFTAEDWWNLSLRLPDLRQLCIRACTGVDVAVLRYFVLYCDVLRAMNIIDCNILPGEEAQFRMWWEASARTQVHLYVR